MIAPSPRVGEGWGGGSLRGCGCTGQARPRAWSRREKRTQGVRATLADPASPTAPGPGTTNLTAMARRPSPARPGKNEPNGSRLGAPRYSTPDPRPPTFRGQTSGADEPVIDTIGGLRPVVLTIGATISG